MKISKGLATWAGLVAAGGQYALAIATFMETFNDVDPTAGLGALATATATLYGVIKGRMDQATAVIQNPAPTKPSGWVTSNEALAGSLVAGTVFSAPSLAGTHLRAPSSEEPGDEDALPDYATTENPPPDEGDEGARPEATS